MPLPKPDHLSTLAPRSGPSLELLGARQLLYQLEGDLEVEDTLIAHHLTIRAALERVVESARALVVDAEGRS